MSHGLVDYLTCIFTLGSEFVLWFSNQQFFFWNYFDLNYTQEEMFIGLLLRAIKSDVNLKRVSAFAKRLLQVGGEFVFAFLGSYLDCMSSNNSF